jgi:hypothetical protein
MKWRFVFVLACISLLASLISLTSGADSNDTSVVSALNKLTATINATNNPTLNYPYASNNSIFLLGVLIILLLLFASAPILLNMYWSYKYLEKGQALLRALVDNSKDKPIDKDLIQTISGSFNTQPVGIQGVGRSTMALTLVVIVGIGVFYVTLYPIDSQKSPLIKDLMLTLAGAISAIVGFYFGGRSGQDSSATAPTATPAPSLAATSNLPPIINSLIPDRPSPHPAGTTINWTADASNPEKDPLFYKFLLKGPSTNDQLVEKTEWIGDNEWAWITPPADTGTFQVEVRVRDGKHAGPESYDGRKMVEYTLIAAS